MWGGINMVTLFNNKAQAKFIIIAVVLMLITTVVIAGTFYVSSLQKNESKTYYNENLNSVTNKTVTEKLLDKKYINDLRNKDSSREYNNQSYKSFNSSEKKILIENDKNKTELEMKLLTGYNMKVGQGKDILVAKFLLIDWMDDKLFDDLNFYEAADNYRNKEKEYWFKYSVEYIEEKCLNISEFSDIEHTLLCHNITRTEWTNFDNLKELKDKNVVVGIFTNTFGDKKVEWIATKNGFDMLEFASYEIVGLSSYYDETSEYSVDQSWSMEFTPDGNYLVVASYIDNYVSIFNVTNKSEIVQSSTFTDALGDYSVERIYSLAISGDGNYLATSSSVDDRVSIMNITNKSKIIELSSYYDAISDYSVEDIRSLDISSDGNYLITSSSVDDRVSIMNITDKTTIAPLASYYDNANDYSIDGIRSLTISSDGNYLITSSYSDDYVSIMNITDKTTIAPLASYYDLSGDYSIDEISSLAISQDDNFLATSSSTDDYVSIMNITDKTTIAPLASYYDDAGDYSVDWIQSLSFSPDGNFLATSSGNDAYVSIMNITDKTAIGEVDTYTDTDGDYSVEGTFSLAVSPDGLYIATSSSTDAYVSIMKFKTEDGLWICDTDEDFDNSTCWSNGILPVAGMNVTFNYQGTGDCNITNGTMPQDLGSFFVDTNYGGTIYFNPLFAVGDWTGNNDGTQLWNVTNNINVSGGTMKIYGDYPYNITDEGHGQEWRSVGGDIIVGSGAVLDGVGLGFPKVVGPGPGSNWVGASHGGEGGGSATRNTAYGNASAPTSLGSGGYNNPGGSAIKLHSTDFIIIDGIIDMDGIPAERDGSAGGSIWLKADNISGSGNLNASVPGTARGGGGRIRLEYGTDISFKGIIELNGGYDLGKSVRGKPGTLTFTNNTWLGDWNLTGNIGLLGGDYGEGNVTNILGNFNLGSGNTLYVYGDCHGNSGSPLSFVCYNTTADGRGVWLNVSGNITIESGGLIDGVALGFPAGFGPGVGSGWVGATHGGKGWNNAKPTYGSETQPTSLGSGGYSVAQTSIYGSSAIKLESGNELIVNGDIDVIGIYSDREGSAGGSIWLKADNISGSGNLNASASTGTSRSGGGRIAFTGDTIDFSGRVYNKGTVLGGGGTVYINASTSITMSGTISTTGYDGGNITFNDTLITLSGTYNATGTNDDASIFLDYTNCASDYSGGTFDPVPIDLSGCTADTCTCPSVDANWEVDMEDYCNLTTPCDLGIGNLSWIGSFGFFNCSAELNLTNRDAPISNTIFYHWAGCEINRL